MPTNEAFLVEILEKRRAKGAFRSLTCNEAKVDFCSNDYLGFARSPILHQKILNALAQLDMPYVGSTGSRLLSGNSRYLEALEARLAEFHRSESALLFNSGFDANMGLFGSVLQTGDTLLIDELIHASVWEGSRLSRVKLPQTFRHNDVAHLEHCLRHATGHVMVGVESVYSMDGDLAPLEEMASVCERYGALLVVDEAHATGVFGLQGEGRVVELGLEDQVFARVHTFGKALGSHGAVVLGSRVLRDYLINYARSLIYTTALPIHSVLAIQCAYDLLLESQDAMQIVQNWIRLFRAELASYPHIRLLPSKSPIQGVLIPGNDAVIKSAQTLQDLEFDIRPIRSPTVPNGKERLRICLHSHNTEAEIRSLIQALTRLQS